MAALDDFSIFKNRCYIDGQWVKAGDNASYPVTNPADGALIGQVPLLNEAQVRKAVDAAQRAWPQWRRRPAGERADLLCRWYELMREHQEALALIMTTEQGKPLPESRGEIAYAASFVRWFAEEARRAYGDIIPGHTPNSRLMVLKEPVGVCAAITPWNFPSAMITRKAAPALAAGCVMVLKPASQTPFSALALAELSQQAGIPPGVSNVVTGAANVIGPVLTGDPAVRKLTFTGSTAVGRELMQQSAATVKKISLELGGNAPFIVFDDADLDAAVDGAIASKYRNAGQTCVCANRILVQNGVYDVFARRLVAKVKALKVGSGIEEGTQIGPLIDRAALEKVEDHLQDALSKGAHLVLGGERHALGGLFFEPTVVTGASADMQVAREETFGPLAALFKFATEADAVRMANDTEFGLAAYFYARDMGRIWRVSEALEYGIVGVNTGIISTEVAPFGGMKQSGIGREGSKYGLDEFMELKYVCLTGIESASE